MRIDSANRIWCLAYFAQVPKGVAFRCNGNTWRKVSTRTAKGVSDGLPSYAFYFARNTVCEIQYATP
jgi:hypothetical protein